MSVKTIIEEINRSVQPAFQSYAGVKIYGVSELFTRKDSKGAVSVIPGISNDKGEITYVGYDDKAPLIIYHRLATASMLERQASSYGDERSDLVSTYNNSMFLYVDRKVMCPDLTSLLEILQTVIPDTVVISGYKNVIVRITSVNFNTTSILRSEYSGQILSLRPERILLQINYQIETTFMRNCKIRCA